MPKVINLKHDKDGSWTWNLTGQPDCVYYTNRVGDGIFVQNYDNGESRQLVGTCQFSACETASGTRRKLNTYFGGPDE